VRAAGDNNRQGRDGTKGLCSLEGAAMPLDPEFLPAVLDQFSDAQKAGIALASLDQVLSRLAGNRLLPPGDLVPLRAELASRAGRRRLSLVEPQASAQSPEAPEAEPRQQ
jgi:hypothetical protein